VANKSDLKIMPKTNNITCYTCRRPDSYPIWWAGRIRSGMEWYGVAWGARTAGGAIGLFI